MDRYLDYVDSSKPADLPWEAYFDAILPHSGISENIPSINTLQSTLSSTVHDNDIIDSADTFNSSYSWKVENSGSAEISLHPITSNPLTYQLLFINP